MRKIDPLDCIAIGLKIQEVKNSERNDPVLYLNNYKINLRNYQLQIFGEDGPTYRLKRCEKREKKGVEDREA